jgi:hypothetical protein
MECNEQPKDEAFLVWWLKTRLYCKLRPCGLKLGMEDVSSAGRERSTKKKHYNMGE